MVDVLISTAIIALLCGLILSGITRARATASSSLCLANLHQIGVGLYQYASENDNRFPDPTAAGKSWEGLIQRYMKQSLVFDCPSDTEMYPSVGSSYDWRDTANPQTTLAGQPITAALRGDAVLAFETLPGWHARHRMNAVLVNGSAWTMTDDACLGDQMQPVSMGPK